MNVSRQVHVRHGGVVGGLDGRAGPGQHLGDVDRIRAARKRLALNEIGERPPRTRQLDDIARSSRIGR